MKTYETTFYTAENKTDHLGFIDQATDKRFFDSLDAIKKSIDDCQARKIAKGYKPSTYILYKQTSNTVYDDDFDIITMATVVSRVETYPNA